MNPTELKRIIEALILCNDAPMGLAQIKSALDMDISNDELRSLLEEITTEWLPRAVRLVPVATGWRFQSAPDLTPYVDRMRAEKPATYSRAVMETLAIIAYRQPVTRGDIEDIRGVTVSSQIIKTLEERGWIDAVGHREVVGRPTLFATTKQFLDDLGLAHVRDLPALVTPDSESAPETSTLDLPGLNGMTENVAELVEDSTVTVHVATDEIEMLDDDNMDENEQQDLTALDGIETHPVELDEISKPNKE